ncbi:MAG: GGDEF domain-containing protein [Chloroflexi bacterium]|nr:GGDEF domain-containing protein [Chloroflexota bacterium]
MIKLKKTEFFERLGLPFWTAICIGLVGGLGIVDYLTGNELSFSLFYLLPVSLAVWYVNPVLGLLISVLSAVTWLAADLSVGENFTHPIIYFWNSLIRLAFFLIVTYLLSELRKSQTTIQALARTDHLTGLYNIRYFHELLEIELKRSGRYKRSFTLVFLDLDDFKLINDRFGHAEGDQLIAFIGAELKWPLRGTDIVSRLGGDEFAILLPETGQYAAKVVMSKIQNHLAGQLGKAYPFVTFSAGAVTYEVPPGSIAETIKIADDLMYSVKNGTKNGVLFSVYRG